jgi:hypothetical protein
MNEDKNGGPSSGSALEVANMDVDVPLLSVIMGRLLLHLQGLRSL